MATTIEEIQALIETTTEQGFRGRLLARGQARAMIWRDGVLPLNSPEFTPNLSYDLHSYGYALLALSLRLRDLGGDANIARFACEQAATALESVITKSNPADMERNFHRIMAAAAYHLGQFSARAYSLLVGVDANENFSPMEHALRYLMLRNLDELEQFVISSRLQGKGNDSAILADFERQLEGIENNELLVEGDDSFVLDGLVCSLEDNFFAAVSTFLLALERGEVALIESSISRLRTGLEVSASLNLLPQWWIHRIAIYLLNDLWSSSFHVLLPTILPSGDEANWEMLRKKFIALLLCRRKAEIDLWPSQILATARALDPFDNLVISLPTSAGKTRIAELCILRCLAAGKRVVFVTPLRALSAQTEIGLQKTFVPLGKTISALYGSIGVSGFDEDTILQRNIVVATPEKLDFALRNDPSLIDDVGLLILDEGHMIGLSEREVRYEVQIQRLLKRPDADHRRIVCLSAILPDGEQLEDFANWLRRDQIGGVVKSEWRPTRLRYGEVIWTNNVARLNLRVGEERPFVPKFLTAIIPPIGKRRTPFPKDLGELCLATAWRLVEDGQSVLIYCPVRAHVEPFADRIVDLHRRGALKTLIEQNEDLLNNAIVLGQEWFGTDHPILQCLRLGIAIHHGALPTAFRKEIERLLREGILKVTISSPTLSQGLNLSATTVIIHSLTRGREPIDGSEFKNVVGRAGRAYVDVEGLVLYPIFDNHPYRLKNWEKLIGELGSREMDSGLVRLVVTLVHRMHTKLGNPPLNQLIEYVFNNAEAWNFPELPHENAEDQELERAKWNGYVASLDTAILSLLGEHQIDEGEIEAKLDEILSSSLWERRLKRRNETHQPAIKSGLFSRAKYIWSHSTALQRKGYFLAGVGYNTGRALDNIAIEANILLVNANTLILMGNYDGGIDAITAIADMVFAISPFIPDKLPTNWHDILRLWLLGLPIAEAIIENESESLQFIEGGLVYRLPWAMEAIRVRAMANGDMVDLGFMLKDVELRYAVAAVETGTLNRSAAILIQAGFSSRLAAIRAVQVTNAQFTSANELRQWLNSENVVELTNQGNWPTPETAEMWITFRTSFSPVATSVWSEQLYTVSVTWIGNEPPSAGSPIRIFNHPDSREPFVLSDIGDYLGKLELQLNPQRIGLCCASVGEDRYTLCISYTGPADLWLL